MIFQSRNSEQIYKTIYILICGIVFYFFVFRIMVRRFKKGVLEVMVWEKMKSAYKINSE